MIDVRFVNYNIITLKAVFFSVPAGSLRTYPPEKWAVHPIEHIQLLFS